FALLLFTPPRPARATLFPTRRSSDLLRQLRDRAAVPLQQRAPQLHRPERVADDVAQQGHPRDDLVLVVLAVARPPDGGRDRVREDRKSTRLNSSHVSISYAVFCLKKK